MSLWIIDASVFLAREDADDTNHADAVRLLDGPDPIATLDLAFYEVTDVAMRAWHDAAAARRLRERVAAIAADGGIISASSTLLDAAASIADRHQISVYDAAYVAAAESSNGELASCDVRDLVSRGLAKLPVDALRR